MDVGRQDNPGADAPGRANRTRRVGRRRVIAALGCVIASVALIAMIPFSRRWTVGHYGVNFGIEVRNGELFLRASPPRINLIGTYGSYIERPSVDRLFTWRLELWREPGGRMFDFDFGGVTVVSRGLFAEGRAAFISLWLIAAPLALLSMVLAISATRSVRRARLGLCGKCHYDLRGLPASAPCPECGKVRVARAVGVASGDEGKGGS